MEKGEVKWAGDLKMSGKVRKQVWVDGKMVTKEVTNREYWTLRRAHFGDQTGMKYGYDEAKWNYWVAGIRTNMERAQTIEDMTKWKRKGKEGQPIKTAVELPDVIIDGANTRIWQLHHEWSSLKCRNKKNQ